MILDKIQDFIRREVEVNGNREKEYHFFITQDNLLEVMKLCKEHGLESQFNKEEKYYVLLYYSRTIKLRILKDLEELVKLQKCVQDSLDLTVGIQVRRM